MKLPKPPVGMLPNGRLDYSAIVNRKPLKLPKGARMVVMDHYQRRRMGSDADDAAHCAAASGRRSDDAGRTQLVLA
jgi:hypothetical protein